MCVCACVCLFFHIILYINCFGRTVLYMCIDYGLEVNLYDVSTECIEARVINVPYYCSV